MAQKFLSMCAGWHAHSATYDSRTGPTPCRLDFLEVVASTLYFAFLQLNDPRPRIRDTARQPTPLSTSIDLEREKLFEFRASVEPQFGTRYSRKEELSHLWHCVEMTVSIKEGALFGARRPPAIASIWGLVSLLRGAR